MAAFVAGPGGFPDLRGSRMDQLVLATVDAAASMAWARALGLLAIIMVCDSGVCVGQNRQMAQVSDKRADGVRWKCTKKQCRKEYSIRKGSSEIRCICMFLYSEVEPVAGIFVQI